MAMRATLERVAHLHRRQLLDARMAARVVVKRTCVGQAKATALPLSSVNMHLRLAGVLTTLKMGLIADLGASFICPWYS